jgi:tetrahydromethanopterin S-methyltransferase subunit G
MERTTEPDLIEKIAYGLPLEVRAEFLNEMRYLRSLSENDEMLRILRAMMFLTLLTEQVPQRVLTEREKLEISCREVVAATKRLEKAESEYYQRLNKQLTQLPVDIATGISPKAIVERINDSLKKQFDLSTIPIIAKELSANADAIKTATKEYTQSTNELCNSWRSASDKAHESIRDIGNAVSKAAEASKKAAINFSTTFSKTYHWALRILISIGIVAGFMIGILIFDYFRPHTKTVYEIPYELLLLIESRQREREQTPAPKQEAKPKSKQEAKPPRLPFGLEPLQDLNIWKLRK